MNPKEQFDACAKLAELAAARHDARRGYEWKVSLGFWGALLASTTIIKTCLPWWSPFALTVVYVISWLIPLWAANDSDKRRFDHFFSEAAKTISTGVSSIGADPPRLEGRLLLLGFFKNWAMWFHIFVTFALAMLVVLHSRGYVG